MFPATLKPVAAALGGLTVAFGVGIGLVQLTPVPGPARSPAADCQTADCGPKFTVEEVSAELVTMSRVDPKEGSRIAAAILAAAHDATISEPADEAAWQRAHEGAYVQVKFGQTPVIPSGKDRKPTAVSQVVFGFRPVQIVVRAGNDLYQYRATKHTSLVRIQKLLSELTPAYPEVASDDTDQTYGRFIGQTDADD